MAPFFIAPAFDAPLGGPHRSIAISCGAEKLEWCGYPTVKKSLMIRLIVPIEYRRVTDGRTDRRTFCDSIVRAIHSIAR